MGLPALKQEPRPVARRPHLRVVTSATKTTARKPSASRQRARGAAYQAFVFFGVVVAVIAVLGAGRVWMSVQAAQASIECGKLQTAIKAARYEGDMLEIQASALSTPSRVQGVAQGQLGMGPATSVSYLKIAPDSSAPVVLAETVPQESERPAVLERLVGVAAAEARILLVGDVGLASSK